MLSSGKFVVKGFLARFLNYVPFKVLYYLNGMIVGFRDFIAIYRDNFEFYPLKHALD